MNVLEEACNLSVDRWIDSLPDNPPEYIFSEKHRQKMNRLFDKMRDDKYHKFTKRTTRVLLVAAIILSFTLTAFAVPASRDFLIKKFKEYSIFSVEDSSAVKISGNINMNYIPDGFNQTENFESEYLHTYNYEDNANQWFSVEISSNSMDFVLDTEEYEYEEIDSGNIKYFLYKSSKNMNGIIWHNEKYTFIVCGNLSKSEILNIAQNLNIVSS